jgi:glycosyltransferase involved in cell wall biosynthesis
LVSIVVRARNEEQHLGKLLYGIERQRFIGPVETILVDSGSTDDTLAIARRFPVRIMHLPPERFSFGRALNLGCAEARGRYLVFASAHVYPIYDDWLDRLLARFLAPSAEPRLALVYGKQRGAGVTKFSEEQVFRRWFPDESCDEQESPFCNNANCAVRREVWQALPYDESLTGLEDLDWARRAQAAGYTLAYSAEAEVAHVHDETPAQTFNRYRREAIALKKIFPEQSPGIPELLRLFLHNTATDYSRAVSARQLRSNLTGIALFRAMQFAGALAGSRQRGPVSEELKHTFYYPRGPGGDQASRPRDDGLRESQIPRPIDYTGGRP